jgi:hypothetical protein
MDIYTMNIVGIVETDKILSKILFCLVLIEMSTVYIIYFLTVYRFSHTVSEFRVN